jgi:hypothetical protein
MGIGKLVTTIMLVIDIVALVVANLLYFMGYIPETISLLSTRGILAVLGIATLIVLDVYADKEGI